MLENCISSSSFVGTAVRSVGRKRQGICALAEVWKEQDGFAHSVQVVAEGQGWAQGGVFPLGHLEKTTTLQSQNGGEKNKIWLAEAAWLKEGKETPNHPPPDQISLKLGPVSDGEDAGFD